MKNPESLGLTTGSSWEGAVISKAVAWWQAKRPIAWKGAKGMSLDGHLDNPTINTTSRWEAELALAVAAYVREYGYGEEKQAEKKR